MTDDARIADDVEEFRSAALRKGDAARTAREDASLHSQLRAAWQRLYACGHPGRTAFRTLLRDPSPHVRSWVAAQLLSERFNEAAVSALEEIAAQDGALGFTAAMTLDVWKAGNLRSPFGPDRDISLHKPPAKRRRGRGHT